MHLETRQPDRTDLCEPDGALATRPIALPTPGVAFHRAAGDRGEERGACGVAGLECSLPWGSEPSSSWWK